MAYIIKISEGSSKPIYSNEIKRHFGISSKQLSGYLCDLEREGYIYRPNGRSPKPIYITKEGKKAFYENVIMIFPQEVRNKIKEDLDDLNILEKENAT